jgi:GT2 family glycosyltransferase
MKEQLNIEYPLVTISLLNWMNYEDTISCVKSIEKLNYKNIRLIIRDNASINNSYEILKSTFPHYQVVRSKKNLGYAQGHLDNYLLLNEEPFELFWILNSDIKLKEDALTHLVDAYKKNGIKLYGSITCLDEGFNTVDFGGVDSDLRVTNDDMEYNSGKLWRHKPFDLLLEAHPEGRFVHSLEGSSLLLPKALIIKYGFMKTDFFMYGEETDYMIQLKRKEILPFLVTKSLVYHANARSFIHCDDLKFVPTYYRRRNFLRLRIENFGMSRWRAAGHPHGFLVNVKTICKSFFMKRKDESYYYALGSLHAAINLKGKALSPEKIYLHCIQNQKK